MTASVQRHVHHVVRRRRLDLGVAVRTAAVRFRLPDHQAVLRPHAAVPLRRRDQRSDPGCRPGHGQGRMTEPLFFKRATGLTVREIAALTGAEPRRGADLDRRITGLPRSIAPARAISLSRQRQIRRALAASGAGACLTVERFAERVPERVAPAVRPRALSRLRRGGARAVSGRAAAVLAVRGKRRGAGRCRASDRAAGERRDDRSGRRDRAARRDRRRNRDRRRCRHRAGTCASAAIARSAPAPRSPTP